MDCVLQHPEQMTQYSRVPTISPDRYPWVFAIYLRHGCFRVKDARGLDRTPAEQLKDIDITVQVDHDLPAVVGTHCAVWKVLLR